jgi:hypothetical protein
MKTTVEHKYNIGDEVYYLHRNTGTRDFDKLVVLSTKIDAIKIKKDNSFVYMCETKGNWKDEKNDTNLFATKKDAIESYRMFRSEEIAKEFQNLDEEILELTK